jgi:tRNA pseudouridine38-40 synthase
MKFKISISYDGNYLHGWEGVGPFKYIKNLIQESLSFTKEKPEIVCGARTDRGVHAHSNTCSFVLENTISKHNLINAMNYHLPYYLRIEGVQEVEGNFDARFSALHRHYKYLISYGKRKPLLYKRVWFAPVKDLKMILELPSFLPGRHNFSSFCPAKTAGNKNRTISQCYIEKVSLMGVEAYEINIIAKSFLHHQIRNIIGALIDVENGHLSMEKIKYSLFTGEKIMINMAPPFGLYLHEIMY